MKDWKFYSLLVLTIIGFLVVGLVISSNHQDCCNRWAQTEIKLNQTTDNQGRLISITERIMDHLSKEKSANK